MTTNVKVSTKNLLIHNTHDEDSQRRHQQVVRGSDQADRELIAVCDQQCAGGRWRSRAACLRGCTEWGRCSPGPKGTRRRMTPK